MKKAHVIIVAIAIATGLTLLLTGRVNPVRAASYTVVTLNDSGAGSLRQAIVDANNAGGSNTVTFSVTGTINLLSALPFISSNLTINGPGAGLMTVRRDNTAGNFGVFRVSSSGTVTVSGLTISNANQFWGILKTASGTLNITDCVVSGNASGTLGGAGLYSNGAGPINITNTTFSGNSANGGEGGAIRQDGTGTINILGSTFSGNFATNLACIENNNTGAINITNTLITGNSATYDAGAICNGRTGSVTVTGSTLSNNSVGNVGGAIVNSEGTVTVTDSTINGNSAGSVGGAIYNNIGTINLTRSTISNNSLAVAGGNGGGIYNNTTGTINITSSTLSTNHAGSSGGGGGLYFSNIGGAGHGTITSSTITGNTAITGGGIIVGNASTVVTIKNTIIAGNTATNSPKDIFGPLTSGGYNLIGNNSGGAIAATVGDQIGTSGSPLDPRLGPLQNNGGLTFTHALQTGSPAFDAGNAFALTTDQRGATRPFDNPAIAPPAGGDNSDIGASEFGDFFVTVGGNITVPPMVVPTGAVRINVSTSTNFKGTFAATPTTGIVRITNAHPAGSYLVTVKAFDSGGAITTNTFNLIVQTASPSCSNPSFTSAADVGTGVEPYSVAVGDFNNDGKQDLAISHNIADYVSIRMGNGMGGFSGSTNVPVGPASHPGQGVQALAVAIGDFNNDGNQDFATANYHQGTVSIRLGNGAGGFSGASATSEIDVGLTPRAIAIGDFDGDGRQDFATADSGESTVSIRMGDGMGGFSGSTSLSIFAPQSVAIGDFNNDGSQDLAVSDAFGGVAIRLGDGAGNFNGSTSIAVADGTRTIAIGDFNNDGKQDFATGNAGSNETGNTVSVRLGDGMGGFSGTTNVVVGTGPYLVAIGDFNTDGKQDFASADVYSDSISIRLGDGLGGFSGTTSISVGHFPISLAIGDFNNDGRQDFAAANDGTNNTSVRLGTCIPNTAPTIAGQVGVTRQQGSPVSNSQIGTVGDAESGAGGVTVTVTSANPSNGVTLSNLVNTNGSITANIVADCTASNASFTLQASDGNLTAIATLNVTVTANTAPTLTYNNPPTLLSGGPTTVNPATGPADNGTFSVAFLGVSPNTFGGTISAISATGVVSIMNAAPAGTYTITIRAIDNCGATHDTSFTLDVTNTAIWNGSVSNNWNAAANWTPSSVPSASNDVIIPATGVSLEAILGASTATVNNLTVAGGRTLTLSGQNLTVNGVLALTGGLIDTGANTLTLGTAASISRTGGQVIGNLRKQFGGAGSFVYAVGTTNGYSPVDVTVTSGAGDLTVRAEQGPQPVVDASRSLQRYWSLTGSGITVNLVFHYLDPTDIPPSGSDADYTIIRVTGGTATTVPNDCASGSPCVDAAANTAIINGVTSFSDWTLGEPSESTAVELEQVTATGYDGGVLIEWQTGFEANNLGFRLYRDEAGKRTLINSQMIAGSALLVGANTTFGAGRAYVAWDEHLVSENIPYWLEDIDLNGQSRWHGPFGARFAGGAPPERSASALLSRVGSSQSGTVLTRSPERRALVSRMTPQQISTQATLAGQPAVKISVHKEAWYRVSAAELQAAGLDPQVDPRLLQLYAGGRQLPINVISDKAGLVSAIEFYGRGLDEAYTNTRVYWLTAGTQPGLRIPQVKGEGYSTTSSSFLATVERRDRTIYFAALRNGEKENFFGAVVATERVEQTLTLTQVDGAAATPVTLEVALQGVTSQTHGVWAYLNGQFAGEVTFEGQSSGNGRFTLPSTLLNEGENQVRLVAQGGASDVSLIDYLRLSYAHRFTADGDVLYLTATGRQALTINGFTSGNIRVLDVTNPDAVQEVAGKIAKQKIGYDVTFTSPEPGERNFVALADEKAETPVKVTANQPSSLRTIAHSASLVIIAAGELAGSLEPLKIARSKQGFKVEIVAVEDIFDEFSSGNKTPQAMKDFLAFAKANWKIGPQCVLMVGDASYDPRNYLGFGDADMVPTKLIDTQLMETASDDWFADFNDDGIAELAIGRLPARTALEASTMVSKIVGYDQSRPSESLLLVADSNEGYDFEAASRRLRDLVPTSIKVEQINRGGEDAATAKARLLEAINRGEKIVSYSGHGSMNVWRGGLLVNEDARELAGSGGLSVFVMMTCLNGYFDAPAMDSLAESLLKAENGGAVAVWASSGVTTAEGQADMSQQLFRLVFGVGGQSLRLGEAVQQAKAAVGDRDIRRTWILFGDPTMKLR